MTESLRGAVLMVGAMAGFAIEDALIKGLSGVFAPAQIIWMLGLGGAAAFALWLFATGQGLWSAHYLRPKVLMRSGCEMTGTCFFVSALALVPLSLASAVIQATPLVVAMGAALFLGAAVGWRRWAAISVGFAGVLLIVRPGTTEFDPAVLLAVAGMLGLAARDLITRTMPGIVSGARLSLHAFAALVPAGLVLQTAMDAPLRMPDAAQFTILACCVAVGMLAYLSIVAATRVGDISVVSSFRYSRMVFALIVGATVFDERPDAATIVGMAIVVAAGLYTLIREARLRTAGLD
ncbi:phosphonate utilization associated putative membrane protein [Jannaschia seosinensis]|uniref:Phosphonate utilization associated putative membrane protein n=1 Tax=Jannaschia seosinensis TaxID=313367 RepID=A0A0M7BHT7_9RHOB|nr:DMT family transporter [Jannaschia seosinensis]CUH40906.1 phosphonate utilization associated putative membrane protein [Jannaschia seosinensis]